jgi:hypothetical protein
MDDVVRRVYLRYAFSRDPKIVSREFEKLRGALKHLETAKGDLAEGANFHAYSQAIDAFRNIKFFVEHAGGGCPCKALVTISKNPFIPSNAVEENPKVFAEALGETNRLEAEFERVQKAAA